ncbi:hypothetical protein SLS58_003780 [Diplodia intermedia]|uniref:DUF6594 domain-containing protein n=1 Tax=Diplodia intermedia TaxID=856260 RepID=A0ABR3TW88_9PEZI
MEEELDILDQRDYKDGDEETRFSLSSVQFDQERNTERQRLLKKIEEKLKDYDALLERESKFLSLARPTGRDHFSLINYIWNQKSIYRLEVELFDRKDDLIIDGMSNGFK